MECIFKFAEIEVKYKNRKKLGPKINTANEAASILKSYFNKDTIHLQEEFIVLYLNNASNIIGVFKSSKGGITSTIVDIRIILAVGLKLACSSIILSHNHPSGILKPSNNDIKITKKIFEAGKLLDITIIDHIIISSNLNFYSLAENGDF
jgi:DNA repair protein RadC